MKVYVLHMIECIYVLCMLFCMFFCFSNQVFLFKVQYMCANCMYIVVCRGICVCVWLFVLMCGWVVEKRACNCMCVTVYVSVSLTS